MSSENHKKYYLSVQNRSVEREYQDLLKMKASSSKRSQDDLELIKLKDKKTETLRISNQFLKIYCNTTKSILEMNCLLVFSSIFVWLLFSIIYYAFKIVIKTNLIEGKYS